jgi:protein-L-isoaspartate(D-aspartate) O-methyltransferase
MSGSLDVQENFQTKIQRSKMIDEQLKKRGVESQQVLDAFARVPRHLFVPEEYRTMAYADRALPIGKGQTISQPYIVAYMTEALGLKSTDRVLEVGTGSGYQAAILAEICDTVYSIEIIESLGKKAGKLLKEIGYANIILKIGDGYLGWQAHAPFDAIIVTCAPTQIPEPLKDQLTEGGRMIIPVGELYVQELILLEKKNDRLKKTKVLPVMFVPMVDDAGKIY